MAEENSIFADRLDRLAKKIDNLAEMNDKTLAQVAGLENDVQILMKSFSRLMDEQKRNAMLQYATTELVAVRQELEQKYGDNFSVRKTMVGVLQATDAKIVRQKTISELTEKLMVTTPNYWLAPCLIAVSAWIGNDKDLAERAIKVAMKMDAEQTAITMALICRRNGRTQACYEWLSIYFSKQTAFKFTDVTFDYVVAYLNGVFGPDEKGKCKDYVDKWLNDIRSAHSDFDAEQKEKWHGYFENNFRYNLPESCTTLSQCCSNFNEIEKYAERVYAVNNIIGKFTAIEETAVDELELKRSIDENLLGLVKSYARDEGPLRREERRLMLIKKYHGEESMADAELNREEQEKAAKVVDMLQQMTNALMEEDLSYLPSQKMAVNILGDYINAGFRQYIDDRKDNFPGQARINIEKWSSEIDDRTDPGKLTEDFSAYVDASRQNDIARIKGNSGLLFGACGFVAIALVMLGIFSSGALSGLGFAGAAVMTVYVFYATFKRRDRIAERLSYYSSLKLDGIPKIEAAVDEWKRVSADVSLFNGQYESGSYNRLCKGKEGCITNG